MQISETLLPILFIHTQKWNCWVLCKSTSDCLRRSILRATAATPYLSSHLPCTRAHFPMPSQCCLVWFFFFFFLTLAVLLGEASHGVRSTSQSVIFSPFVFNHLVSPARPEAPENSPSPPCSQLHPTAKRQARDTAVLQGSWRTGPFCCLWRLCWTGTALSTQPQGRRLACSPARLSKPPLCCALFW